MKPYYQDDRFGITIYHGDCLSMLPSLESNFVLTDPPYGIGYSSGHGSKVWGDGSIDGDESTETRDAAIKLCDGKPMLVFGSWKRQRPTNTRMVLIWDTLGALGMGDLLLPWKPAHQEIYVLGPSGGFHGNRDTDVIRHPPVQSMAKNGRRHPFEKPIGLLSLLLQKAKPGVVIDPFMGSGSTLRAAKDLGRKAIGIEVEEEYCELAANRLSQDVFQWEEEEAKGANHDRRINADRPAS